MFSIAFHFDLDRALGGFRSPVHARQAWVQASCANFRTGHHSALPSASYPGKRQVQSNRKKDFHRLECFHSLAPEAQRWLAQGFKAENQAQNHLLAAEGAVLWSA